MNLFSILVPIFYRFIGITTQQTNTSKVNKIRRISFKILTSIFFLNFLLEFLTNLSCSRPFWGLRNMKPHAFKNSHTEPGSPHPCSSYPPQRRHFLLSYWSLYPVRIWWSKRPKFPPNVLEITWLYVYFTLNWWWVLIDCWSADFVDWQFYRLI